MNKIITKTLINREVRVIGIKCDIVLLAYK